MVSSVEPEKAITEKIKTFQELIANAEWEKVVACYAPNATLSHFMAPEALTGRDSILTFFTKNSEGYALDLSYTITQLGTSDPSAWLVAGTGSVDKGPWCCFVERWEMIDGEWLMVEDKVHAPEAWMK